MSDELALPPTFNPMALLQSMIEKGADPSAMEKVSALAERWLEIQAKERFGNALAEFRKRCPHIVQKKVGDTGKFKFKYAAYEDIRRITDPIDAELGISTDVSMTGYDPATRVMSGTLRVRVGSYYEDKQMFLRAPELKNAAGMDIINVSQQDGQGLSYFSRYAFILGRGIVVTDEDNENVMNAITPEQVNQVKAAIDKCPTLNMAKFLAWLGVPKIEEIPVGRFPDVMDMLKAKAAQKPSEAKA